MPLSVGDKLGPYEILAPIGAGGMGEVYRARDTRLGRDVAIKVSADKFTDRFEREARAIAALNHPNVCALYDVGPDYLVMELIEGETLKGPLPIETALDYAHQIADALEAAHEKGIIHRDLKPGNIKITPQGVVKVLDFGLAKRAETAAADPENSPTMTTPTRAGMIMGTAAYMSPEQARGKTVDKRADIWAFGVVFDEMLTGKSLFKGEDVSETLAAVIKQDPDLSRVPPKLRPLLERCLEKDPKKRLRDIGDWRLLIDARPAISAPASRTHRWLWPGVAAVLGIGLSALAFVHFREKPLAPAAAIRFQIPPPESAPLGTLLNVSPDGGKVAFLAGGRLWVHFFESGESRNLTDAGGTPFWSPDSRSIAYAVAGKLKRIEATGGPTQTVTDYQGLWGGGAWNQDDLIVFSNRTSLFKVPAAGGVPVQICTVDSARQETVPFPSFLPDGRHFLYTRRSNDDRKSAIYLGSVDLSPEQQSSKPLANSFWGPQYAPSTEPGIGHMLFVREETLMAQRFDNQRLELTGQAAPVAEQISDGRAVSASANGVLVYQRTSQDTQFTWYSREGKLLETVGDWGPYRSIALSPNGTRAALIKGNFGRASNLWLLDLSRGTSSRFVFGSASETSPVWSPDERRIVFSSNRDGPYNLYQKPASGEKDEEVLLKSSENKAATSWSRDGRFLLYTVLHPTTQNDIWVLQMEGGKKPVPFLITEFNEQNAQFSPDGHSIAYVSDESGQSEIYVRSFSMNSAGTAVEAGGKWPISSGGGGQPRWRNDGRELYYLSRDAKLMAVEIASSPVFRAGQPQPLGLAVPLGTWDSTADGKRLLISTRKITKPEPYTVILNWQSALKK